MYNILYRTLRLVSVKANNNTCGCISQVITYVSQSPSSPSYTDSKEWGVSWNI